MRTIRLSRREVLRGYDAVSKLYPTVPPLSMWRAWEFAAYRKFRLSGPVLDVGCGDGRFFRLIWPRVHDVVGVDADPKVTDLALQSGVYRKVVTVPADKMQFSGSGFAAAFANCSLEHMDNIDAVLKNVAIALRPGGGFAFSVVTDKFVGWNSIADLLRGAGYSEAAEGMQRQYDNYHHLINALTPGQWAAKVQGAGFELTACVPVVPEISSRVFLALDGAWHVPSKTGGEVGEAMHARFCAIPKFAKHFRSIFGALLAMDNSEDATSGVVFLAHRK